MTKLHHATAKRAEDNGVTMFWSEVNELWEATKGALTLSHENASQALDGAMFAASLKASYPALTLAHDGREWFITHNSHRYDDPLWKGPKAPTSAIIADLQEACDERELDIEEGFDEDEEDQKTGSVVDPSYKRQYAEDGHPGNNGDWLNGQFALLKLVTIEGKKTRTDVQALNTLFADNGIISEDHAFGGAFHGTSPRTNGWEGRFRMSGGNMLRKRVADAGHLIAFGEKHEAPADFVERYRTKPKAKKAKAKEEAPTENTEEAGA